MPVTSKSSDKLIANNHLYLSVLEITINMFYASDPKNFSLKTLLFWPEKTTDLFDVRNKVFCGYCFSKVYSDTSQIYIILFITSSPNAN